MKRSTHHLLAAILAGLFGLFLTYGSLTSSDFPRGLYGPPNSTHWDDFEQLNPNRVWNYNWSGNGNLASYLSYVYDHGCQAVLRLHGSEYNDSTFWMEYYSCGQHHVYEAELNYQTAHGMLENENQEGFYYFWHHDTSETGERGEKDETQPEGGVSWKCLQSGDNAGIMLHGPGETRCQYMYLKNEQTIWPESVDSINFKAIIRVMADAAELNASDTIFQFSIYLDPGSTTMTDDSLLAEAYYTKSTLGGIYYPDWVNFELDYTLKETNYNILYRVKWMDRCNFWVDYIKFMDMDRAYYLFYSEALQESVLAYAATQCGDLEAIYGDTLAGWKQSDEPIRSSFRAHGVVNDWAPDHLQYPSLTPFALTNNMSRNPALFALFGKPPILDTDIYSFGGADSIGNQVELDTLAKRLERAYDACGDSIPLCFTGQVHSWYKDGAWAVRDPMPPEIYAETYMALAHGAKGITFYKYTSNQPVGTSYGFGLVDTSYQHPYGAPHFFGEKWDAVQLVFSQLDAIGGTLLELEREAAYYPER
jgi:hypothetical protein